MATNNKPSRHKVRRCIDDIVFSIEDQTIEHGSLYGLRVRAANMFIYQVNPAFQFSMTREELWEETMTLCMIADELLAVIST